MYLHIDYNIGIIAASLSDNQAAIENYNELTSDWIVAWYEKKNHIVQ